MNLKGKVEYILGKFDEVKPSISTIVNNKTFIDALDNAGSIGGLIKISLSIMDELKQHFTSKEKLAFSELLSIMIKSLQSSLEADNYKIEGFEKNADFIDSLFSIFLIDKLNTSMFFFDNPVINRFIKKIEDILRNNDVQEDDIKKFKWVFKISFENELTKLDKTANLYHFMQQARDLEKANEIIRYLDYSQSLLFQENEMDNRFLYEYYIPNKTVLVDIEYWDTKSDDKIPQTKPWKISEFLYPQVGFNEKIPEDYYIVIGANFGIGKSSFAKYWTYKIAKDYNELDNPDKNHYIPIFVSLKYAGKLGEKIIYDKVWNGEDLDYVLEVITDKGTKNKRKIVCFMDGLDELQDASKFYYSIKDYHRRFPGIKFIITTRLESDFPNELRLEDEFVRLCPFTEKETEEFFTTYLLNFDYTKVTKVLDMDVLSVPLFCWIAAFTFSSNIELLSNTVSSSNMFYNNEKITKTDLYIYFIHSIIKGHYSDNNRVAKNTDEYYKEKSLLRRIAALKAIDNNLSVEDIEKDKIFQLQEKKEDVKKIISTYFFEEYSDKSKNRVVEFIHKSFREYLLAEFYIECILNDRGYCLNLGNLYNIFSEALRQFLTGLMKVMKEKKEKKIYTLLINSFYDNDSKKNRKENLNVIDDLFYNAKKIFEKDQVIIIGKEHLFREENYQNFWTVRDVDSKIYPTLVLHKWLALFILNKSFELLGNLEIEIRLVNKENLGLFLKLSSAFIPKYYKIFSHFDLSNIRLSGIDFSFADLSFSNLSNTDLFNTGLWRANLSNALLYYADLSNSILWKADLSDANLSGANLSNANLSGANLKGAVILNAKNIKRLNIDSESNFVDAIIDDRDLYYLIKSKVMPNSLPILVNSKEDLIMELEKMYTKEQVNYLVKISKFA